MLEETQHLSPLVEDLRTLANAEAGALDLQKEPVDPTELIRDAAASFDRKIEVDISDELPLINVDPMRIREILLNLLSNAVRQTGNVSIHAEMHPKRLIIRVVDTGSGIAPEDLPRIFERFRKGRDSHGSGKGTTVTVSLPR